MRHRGPLGLGLLAVATAVLTAGCGGYAYRSVVANVPVSGSGQVGIATHDQRSYVVSGRKTPDFVGIIRGGFGNPYDLATDDGRPLADGMTEAIANSLKPKGFRPVPVSVAPSDSPAQAREKAVKAGGTRTVLLTLREWRSDAMYRTGMDYDVTLSVLDGGGAVLAEKRLQGSDNLGGASGARDAAIQAFRTKLETLLGDPAVAQALAGAR